MQENNQLQELARMFRVAPSAVRYWDGQGLLRFERAENNYRKPTFQTLMDLCDVILYRSLSLPLKEIREVPRMDRRELGRVLGESGQRLEQELKELEERMQKLRAKRMLLERLERLRAEEPAAVRARLPALHPFSFQDGDAVQVFIHDAYRTALWAPAERSGPPLVGLIAPGEGRPVLRPGDEADEPYLHGLFRMESDGEGNDVGELLRRARELGGTPGDLVGRYLASACEGETRYDFYEGWLRLL